MRPKEVTLTLVAPDDNGICTSDSPSAGNLTIDGALATGGVATLDVARHIEITSDGNDSPNTFTVTGTDRNGVVITETILGPNADTQKGSKNFATITQIAINNDAVGNIIVGTADEADTQPIPCDHYRQTLRYQGSLSSGGGMDYEVQYSLDNPFDPDFDEATATWHTAASKSGDFSDTIQGVPRIVRGSISSFISGTFTLILTHTRNQ